jgi:undecaprenyl-diphosphatase
MSIIEAVTLGVIQGITEWLPISSSGHLVLYQQIAKVDAPLLFNVLLHFASLLVILVVFRQRIMEIFKSPKYIRNIIIGSIPIALAGFFGRDIIEASFSNTRVVAVSLIITGVLLFLTRFSRDKTTSVTPLNSIIIGISQAFALIPGISRSGATISTGMLSGIKREKSAEFSFILAMPAILGATLFEILEIVRAGGSIDKSLIMPLSIGMVVSFIVGYFSLELLLKIVKSRKFFWFSFYCIALGVLLIIK